MKKTAIFIGGPAAGKVVHGVKDNYFVWWVESKEIEYKIHKYLYYGKYYYIACIDQGKVSLEEIEDAIRKSNTEGYES